MSDTSGSDRVAELTDDAMVAANLIFKRGYAANPRHFRKHFGNILGWGEFPEILQDGIDLSGLGNELSPVLIKTARRMSGRFQGPEREHFTNQWLMEWMFYFNEVPDRVVRSAMLRFEADDRLPEEYPAQMIQLYVRLGKIDAAWNCLEGALENVFEEGDLLETIKLLRPKSKT